MTIGKRISKCRKEKNLSQEYIAECLNVSRQAVSKWENNQTLPDTDNLIQLAKLFGVSVEYLACGEEGVAKIVYIEKNISLFKIIGIELIIIGIFSAALGLQMAYMFDIGMLSAALGILLLALKRDGFILGTSIIIFGTAFFLKVGFTSGIGPTTFYLVAGISFGLHILIYTIIKVIKIIKKKSRNTKSTLG